MKNHIQSEIVRQLDLYQELLEQHDFKRAGDLYSHYMYQLSKRLTENEEVFKQIVDDLLFYHDKPHIQIEIATEAIGRNYRRQEAIDVLEKIATWTPDMTLQSARGKNCNTAQMRLHNLLGYPYDTLKQSWERPEKIEVTDAFQKYFDERAKRSMNVSEQRVGFTYQQEQIQLKEITAIYNNDHDEFLFSCRTMTDEQRYMLVTKEGNIVTVFPPVQKMEPFIMNRSIVLTEENMYGVLTKEGDFCIPPHYQDISRRGSAFFMCDQANNLSDFYHHSGRIIFNNIVPDDIKTNNASTFIYKNDLYDEQGQRITSLANLGTDWDASTDLGEYTGFNGANELIFIDQHGKELELDKNFETQLFLDQTGEVFIKAEHGKETLTVDVKVFLLDGESLCLVKRFSNDHFIVRGEWAEGHYLWINRKKKRLQFFEEIVCSETDYFFAKKRDSAFWLVIDYVGKLCVTEKNQIISIIEGYEPGQWILEDVKLARYFLLPISKKRVPQQKLIEQFIRKNKMSV